MAADAFFVAFRIPSLLRELLAEGSMSAAFIPVFSRYLTTRSREEAVRLSHAVFTTLLLLAALVVVIGVLLAPWLVAVMAPGFLANPDKYALTLHLTRIMFPYLLFVSLGALAMGMLNAVGLFGPSALSSIMLSIGMVGTLLLFGGWFRNPIYALGVGVVIGGLGQFLFQVPSLYRRKLSFRWRWEPKHPGVREIGLLILPMILGLSVNQINILVNTILASYLPEGSVAHLYYALRLIQFPQGIFGVALASAILPTLAALAAKQQFGEFRETFSFSLRLIFLITLPAMVGLIVLRVPIISLLFQSKAFDLQATQGTAWALLFYAMGLWAFAAVRVVVQAFYSLRDTRTPVKAGAAAVGVNILLSLLLMGPLQQGGLALAASLSSAFNFGVLVWILRKRIGHLYLRQTLKSLSSMIAAAGIMGGILWVFAQGDLWTAPVGQEGLLLEKATRVVGAMAAGVVSYVAVLYLLQSRELIFLWGMVRKKPAEGSRG
jgi:putative peptidoglycan lipid II flippase